MSVERNLFQKIPFIRIFSLFLIGILLRHFLTLDLRWTGILCTVLISALIIFWHNSNFTTVKIQNLLISFGIVLCGVFYPNQIADRQLPTFPEKDYYLAEVCQKPAEKAKTFQTILLIANRVLIKPEKVVVYFSKEKFDSTITTGDQLVILTRPQEIRNAGNPFEIDYQTMMNRNGIWFSAYLSKDTYLKTGNHSNRLIFKAEQFRDQLISMLTVAIPEKEERSVVSALTLGYRTEIDQETLDYFASTGAMHVLSVSGLHVALIYIILGFFLSFLKRGRTGIIIFTIVMISFLWFYAFLTGFSAAVQRATVMFTFVVIGNSLRRQVNIYNSLTASAFFLMLLNPNVLFDIGFQLSYLAVFGIVLIQPSLNNLIVLSNPILKWCWSLFTVSIAAQFITFPLGLFYFNQFPNLFWLSSYVVIPVTTVIIWLTLAFFILSPFHGFAMFIGWIIEKSTHIMLLSLKAMDAFPLAVTKGIVLTPFQVWLLFGCIVFFILFIGVKQKAWLFSTLSMILLFQVTELYEKTKVFNQKAVIVYNSKNLMVQLINGRTNYLITPDFEKLSRSEKSMFQRVSYHLRTNPVRIIANNQAKPVIFADIDTENNRMQFINSTIKFSSLKGFSKTQDLIELSIYPEGLKANPETRTIYLGNIGSDNKEINNFFKIKQDGAFYADFSAYN
jgi:competence protein ComEC